MGSGDVLFGMFAFTIFIMIVEEMISRRRRAKGPQTPRSGSPAEAGTDPDRPSGRPSRPFKDDAREQHSQALEALMRKEAELREWSRSHAYKPPHEEIRNKDADEDRDYADFVQKIWGLPGLDLPNLKFERIRFDGERSECILVSIVKVSNGALYVNAHENGRRCTFRADRNHHWSHDGHAVDGSAFVAVARGVSFDVAFARDDAPASISEALEPRNNRFGGSGRAFVIGYMNEFGIASFRVISGVLRSDGKLSARCHYRWGERRTFLFDRISAVADAQTGEVISREVFFAKRAPGRPRV